LPGVPPFLADILRLHARRHHHQDHVLDAVEGFGDLQPPVTAAALADHVLPEGDLRVLGLEALPQPGSESGAVTAGVGNEDSWGRWHSGKDYHMDSLSRGTYNGTENRDKEVKSALERKTQAGLVSSASGGGGTHPQVPGVSGGVLRGGGPLHWRGPPSPPTRLDAGTVSKSTLTGPSRRDW